MSAQAPVDQRRHGRCAVANAPLVPWSIAMETEDIEPRAHFHAAVDRDGPDGRVREHEPDAEIEAELGNDRNEIVAVRSESVEPDDGQLRISRGNPLDALE
jgi:hypothetical protein